MAAGALWMVLFKFAERSLGIVSTIILARLLVPADFGLVAMAMSVIAALELLSAFGFEMALIQNAKATREHYDTAWTFAVLFGLLSAILLCALAVPAAQFYNDPRLAPVMFVLAAGTLVQGFENVGVVAFRKEMEFNKEFGFLLGKKLASFSVTIPLALWWGSYWALVVGIVVGRFASVLLSYIVHSYRPRFCLVARHELFHFSKWIVVNNILGFLRLRSADFIVGKISGPHALGVFSVASEIALLPTTELVAPINRAVFPGYSKLADDLAALRDGYLNVIGMICLFAIPAGAGIAITADLLVGVILGEKWLEAIPIIQMLAVFGVLMAIQTNNSVVMIAIGKPRLITIMSVVSVLLMLPLLVLLTRRYGVEGAAMAYLIATAGTMPVSYYFLVKELDLRVQSLLSVFWRPLFGAGVMCVIFMLLVKPSTAFASLDSVLAQLLLAVIASIAVYGIAATALWWLAGRPAGPERSLLIKARERMAQNGVRQ